MALEVNGGYVLRVRHAKTDCRKLSFVKNGCVDNAELGEWPVDCNGGTAGGSYDRHAARFLH